MRTRLPALVAVCLFAASAEAEAEAEDRALRVYNWTDYIAPGVVEEFERETGIDVVYETFESGETLETTLLAGGSGYDLVVFPTEYLGRLVEAEALQEIDAARIPNHARLDPRVMRRLAAHDPGNRFTAPYLWGTTGVGYDVRKIAARMPDAPVDDWAMLMDPAVVSRFADCGVGMVDAPEEALAAALLWLGRDPLTAGPADVAEALDALAAVSPYVTVYDSAIKGPLERGELCLVLGWSTDLLSAAQSAAPEVELAFATPAEGGLVWFDVFAIPADSAAPDAARRFIDFMLRPEIIARCSSFVWAPHAVPAAMELVDPEVRRHPAVFPTDAAVDRLVPLRSWDGEMKRRLTRVWTEIKLGDF